MSSRLSSCHYLRWVLFDIGKDTYFMYQGILSDPFDKYTDDAVLALFSATGVDTVFENLEGFPADWKTNVPAFIGCPLCLAPASELPGIRRIPVRKCGRDQEGLEAPMPL